jgi:hypothetical protein
MSNETYPIYEAQVGQFGSVAFFKDPESHTYCFMFFNGMDWTPLYLSEDAAYYVWMFIGCEHPDATISPEAVVIDGVTRYPARKTQVNNFATAKKAGCGKPKKQPSKPTKKKAKSK